MLFYFTGDGSLLKADFREDGHEKAWIWSVSDVETWAGNRFKDYFTATRELLQARSE